MRHGLIGLREANRQMLVKRSWEGPMKVHRPPKELAWAMLWLCLVGLVPIAVARDKTSATTPADDVCRPACTRVHAATGEYETLWRSVDRQLRMQEEHNWFAPSDSTVLLELQRLGDDLKAVDSAVKEYGKLKCRAPCPAKVNHNLPGT